MPCATRASPKQLSRPAPEPGSTATKTPLPKSDMRSHKLVDGVVWDGKDPARYADGFKLKA